MNDDIQYIGEKVSESEDEISRVLNNTQDTLRVQKSSISKQIVLNKTQSKVIYDLLNDGNEKIKLKNGAVFIGNTIDENQDYVVFGVKLLSDTILLDKKDIITYINKKDYFLYANNKYLNKGGSMNSIKVVFVPGLENSLYQFEFLRYKLVNQNQGFGAGVGLLLGSFDYDYVGFTEFFLYSKTYLNNNNKRLFFDLKLGAALKHQDDDVAQFDNYSSYSSGPQLQYGIGVDFANSRYIKWSFYIGHLIQFTKTEQQITLGYGVRNRTEKQIINLPTIGTSLNF